MFGVYIRLTLLTGAILMLMIGCSEQSLTRNLETSALTVWVDNATTDPQCQSGTTNTSCGTSTKPYKKIVDAVNRINSLGATNAPGSVIMVRNGIYEDTRRIQPTVSGTVTNPITLRAENIVTGVNSAKNVTIRYTGIPMGAAQGIIEANNVSYWIIEGFRVESANYTLTTNTTYNGFTNTNLQLPRGNAGIQFRNGDNITIRYNHIYNTAVSGIIFRPISTTACPDAYLPGSTTLFYFDTACAIQNSGNKVLYNKVELANQGWDNNGTFIWGQEALTMWGVNGNFEVAYNRVINSTREGIDIKLGHDGTVHRNVVSSTGLGVPAMNIAPNGVGIYLDGRRENMYNIKIYNNIVSNNGNVGIGILTERPVASPDNRIYNIQVYNNLVHGNSGLGLQLGDAVGNNNGTVDVQIYHNTFAQNNKGFMLKTWHQGDYPENISKPPKNVMIRNNIFANDTGGASVVLSGTNLTIDKNLGTYQGAGNNVVYWNNCGSCVNASPNSNLTVEVTTGNPNPVKFVSLSGSSYFLGLQSTSPAINQGSTTTGPAPTDFDGVSRPSAYVIPSVPSQSVARPDMGAYEFRCPNNAATCP